MDWTYGNIVQIEKDPQNLILHTKLPKTTQELRRILLKTNFKSSLNPEPYKPQP